MIEPAAVAARLAELRERFGPRADAITVVAVTKAFGRDAVEAAVAAGVADVGESYAQECVAKLDGPDTGANVHFIGNLQRNKVRRLAPVVDVWQSIDRPSLVDELAKRAPGARVMVQVDISGEPQKGGCAPETTGELVARAVDNGLDVVGLMGVGPIGPPEDARPGFARLRSLVDSLGLAECSMGMSADIDVAVEEGTTMVRVGTGLFGPRPLRR
ncbi:MAG: YggS family pyridoxal phosphate enzyme [Acidimicrobiales bacterium]|nr:YggS family pyridoxal phosphate enzyme [Acidimicrobiales bacterium]